MIPARPFVIALLLSASAGGASAADDPDKGLVACIEKARQADATCAKLTDEPAQRLECFQKARAEQLGCLEHALSDAPTGATAPVSPPEPSRQTSPGEQPSKSATSEPPSQPAAPPPQANPQENPGRPAESTQANSPANPPANPQMSTQETAPTQDNAVTNAPEPRPDTATASPPANPPPATVEATPPQPPAAQTVEHPPAAARAEMQKGTKETSKDTPKETTNKEAINKDVTKETPKSAPKPSEAQAKPPESKWVVSETTSPIDYRPLLTAVIQPSSSSPGSPSRLAIRCRGTQTEFLIHTDGTWQTQRKNVLPVDRQVNDQAVMHERWTLSADAKTAMYAENTIELLKSLPDGARLTVNVPDAANARHEATFQLTGWDAIRKKIAAACKWPKMIDQASGHR